MFSSKCSGKSCYPKQYWEICNINFKIYLLGLSEATFKTMPHCQNQWNTCLNSDTGCVKQSANCYCFGDNYMDQPAEKSACVTKEIACEQALHLAKRSEPPEQQWRKVELAMISHKVSFTSTLPKRREIHVPLAEKWHSGNLSWLITKFSQEM